MSSRWPAEPSMVATDELSGGPTGPDSGEGRAIRNLTVECRRSSARPSSCLLSSQARNRKRGRGEPLNSFAGSPRPIWHQPV